MPRIQPETIAAENGERHAAHRRGVEYVGEDLARRAVDAAAIIDAVAEFDVALPSWALGTGGTRFGRFPIGGEPRTTEEKIDDAAAVNALTTANPAISLHMPWDLPSDPRGIRQYAAEQGIVFDAVNSNTFQDDPRTTRDGEISYKFGSMAHTDPTVRAAALEHNYHVVDLGVELGSTAITVWLGDGTNHPGQASFRGQFERVADCLHQLHDYLPDGWTLLIEHKPYEPAFYSSVNTDWGSSLLLAEAAGPSTRCIVDLGHHLPNTNIEQVVSRLAMVGRLGGFHFNDSKYGDDDLTTGSIKPFQLFLIMLELLEAGHGTLPDLAYMIDQSHNLKDPLEDLLQATEALQIALAQALCVDRRALVSAQESNDPALATEILMTGFRTDVRPLVAEARLRAGGAIDLVATYRRAGYREAAIAERGLDARSTGL